MPQRQLQCIAAYGLLLARGCMGIQSLHARDEIRARFTKLFIFQRQKSWTNLLEPHRLLQFIAHLVTDINPRNLPIPHVENTFNKLNLEKINCATENESIKCEKMFAIWVISACEQIKFRVQMKLGCDKSARKALWYERTEKVSVRASHS